jgi:hypothetical protein
MDAAENLTLGFDAVANDFAAALRAFWCQYVNGALE